MARKKKADSGGGGGGDWLNTYADMVTLLLTFFILLFSMSKMDAAKFNMLVKAFASDNGTADTIVIKGTTEEGADQTGMADLTGDQEIVEDMEDIYKALKEFVEAQNLEDSVDVSKGDGWVFIRFMNDMLFEPNSAILKPQDREILNFVGTGIKSVQSDTQSISIVGHTAAIPGAPDYRVSDRQLSTDRANAVLMFFEDDIGIDGTKLFAQGYGKWKPFADNETEEGRSQNRRVEILISSEGNSLSEQLDNVYEKLVE